MTTTGAGIFETARKYVSEGAGIIGNGVSKLVGRPVVRENVEKASKIVTEVGDMAKKGLETVANSEFAQKAIGTASALAPVASAAAPIVNDLVSNFVNKPQNSNTHATNLDEGKNPPTDSKSEGQTVNLGDLASKAKDVYDKLPNRLGKRKNSETSSAESQDNTQANPQDAQTAGQHDTEGGGSAIDSERSPKRQRVMTPQDAAREAISKQIDDKTAEDELVAKIDANTNRLFQGIVSTADSIAALSKSIGDSTLQKLGAAATPASPQSSQQPSQYPQPQAQPYQNTSGNAVYDNKFSSNSDLDEDQDQYQNILNSNNPKKRSAYSF